MQSLKGKVVLITGATEGLGKEVAKRAAIAGAHLILHGRNSEKGEALLRELIAETGNLAISYYNADFSSLEQVNQLGKNLVQDQSALDVLINNAAIGGGPKGHKNREVSKDGYELRFAVNYLAHFLLTQKLLPLLMASSASRIVHISSIGQAPLDFNDLMMEKQFDSYTAYCRSKLAQIIIGMEEAELLKEKGITVNSLHPATLMNTQMVHEFFGHTMTSVSEGADVVEYVAFSEETAGITGTYFNQKRKARAHAQAYDPTIRQKLWQISEKLTAHFRQ